MVCLKLFCLHKVMSNFVLITLCSQMSEIYLLMQTNIVLYDGCADRRQAVDLVLIFINGFTAYKAVNTLQWRMQDFLVGITAFTLHSLIFLPLLCLISLSPLDICGWGGQSWAMGRLCTNI